MANNTPDQIRFKLPKEQQECVFDYMEICCFSNDRIHGSSNRFDAISKCFS